MNKKQFKDWLDKLDPRSWKWDWLGWFSWILKLFAKEEPVATGVSGSRGKKTKSPYLVYADPPKNGEEFYPQPEKITFWVIYLLIGGAFSFIIGLGSLSLLSFGLSVLAFIMLALVITLYAIVDGKYLNIFFIGGFSGRSQLVVEGEAVPVKSILPFKGFRVIKSKDPERDGDIVRDMNGQGCGGFHIFNNYWMGLFGKDHYSRKAQFDEWALKNVTRKDEGGRDVAGQDYTIVHHDKLSPYTVHIAFDYAFELKKAEDSKNMPLDITLSAVGYFINVLIPFLRRDIFDTLRNNILSAIRSFIGSQSFEALRSEIDIDLEELKLSDEERKERKAEFEQRRKEAREEKEKTKKEVRRELSLYIFSLNHTIPDQEFGLIKLIKFVISVVNIIDIDISPEWAKGYRLAQQKVFEAEQGKIVTMIDADAKLYARNQEAKGDANYVKQVKGEENRQHKVYAGIYGKNKLTAEVALAKAIEETDATALTINSSNGGGHLATLPLTERTPKTTNTTPSSSKTSENKKTGGQNKNRNKSRQRNQNSSQTNNP